MMTKPLTVTFNIDQPDNILERGAVLTDTAKAVEAFKTSMEGAKHKLTVTTTEGEPEVKTRKPRTVHPVADAPAQPPVVKPRSLHGDADTKVA
jgi:hypothetical protein